MAISFSACLFTLSLNDSPLGKALETGQSWGDILVAEDEAMLAAETDAQRIARLKRVEAADENHADGIKEYNLSQRALIHTKHGALKHTSGRPCRDAEEPAKWVKGKKKLGTYKEWAATDPKATAKPSVRPAGVPADAIFWSYGCEPHAKGCCPHLHPGDADYEKSGRKPLETILKNAVYLSNKPLQTPPPSPNTFPMSDSW